MGTESFLKLGSKDWIGFDSGRRGSTSRFFLRKFGKQEAKSSKNNENFRALCQNRHLNSGFKLVKLEPFTFTLSRNRFLKFALKCFALTAVSLKGVNCGPGIVTPGLRGISEEAYHNFKSLQEVFLKDNPVANFDLGLALDNYVYGHPYPIETESILQLLASIPSSILAAMFLDFSFTPIAKLPPIEREKRLLSWKSSSLGLKRGVYTILRQISFFLLSSDREYQKYVGYLK